jgi:hypothetical protein
MTPRLASSIVTLENFCREVFHGTVDEWKRLAPQWRGVVLLFQHQGQTLTHTLGRIDRGEINPAYDPQATFDTFLGNSPS